MRNTIETLIVYVDDPLKVILELIFGHFHKKVPPEQATIFRSGDAYVDRKGRLMSKDRILKELAYWFDFQKITKKDCVSVHPPKTVIDAFSSEVDERIPELLGDWHGPLIRRDGTVVTKAGYDRESKMMLSGWDGPEIDDTKEDAEEALLFLWETVNGPGPLEDLRNFAAWSAHLLTVAARPIILGPVPLFLYESSGPGSGKTTLSKLAGQIGGQCPATTTYERRAELGRNLSDHLLKAAVVIDNVEGKFDNQVLASAITDQELLVRRMRENPVKVPMRCVLSVTANGPDIARDWLRRSIPIAVEPAKLDVTRDLLGEVDEMHVCAVYTILSAWLKSGEAPSGTVMKSFQDWTQVVAGALTWLGLPDVVAYAAEKIDQLVSSDEDWTEVLDTIENKFGCETFTAGEAYAALGGTPAFQIFDNARSFGQRIKSMSDTKDGLTRAVRPQKKTKKGWIYRIVLV